MSKAIAYSGYLDFGQAWLGDLPAHWKVMRTKFLFDLVTEPAPVGNSEELLSVYTALGVKPRKDLEARGNKASTTDNYWIVKKGDIIVNKLLAWMGAIGISEYNGVTSPAYDILRAKKNVNPYFYNYLFRNPIASREFKRHSRGIMDMRLRLYFTRFGDIKLPLPPIKEQDKIVEYLKFKLTIIGRFIRKKKQLIKFLNEQKAAIINHAVTKGLDHNIKMKPSGIDWLGDIPENWEVMKLKYVADFKSGEMITSESISSEGKFPVYGGGGFRGYTSSFTNEGSYVLIGRQGALCGNIKYAHDKFWASEHAIVTYIKIDIETIFLGEILTACNLGKLSQTAAQPGIAIGQIKNVAIPIPPKRDQNNIVSSIKEETIKIETTISTIKNEITLTQEYRTAIIDEAVTGKIDVRDYVISEIQKEETYDDLEEELSLAAEDMAEFQNG